MPHLGDGSIGLISFNSDWKISTEICPIFQFGHKRIQILSDLIETIAINLENGGKLPNESFLIN